MTREQVDAHLRMHVMNICLAAVSKQEGFIRECRELLTEKVFDMIEHEVRECRENFDALQKALVGETGMSAILEAQKLRSLSPL